MIKELDLALGKTFINESEKKYLTASIQKPVSAENLGKKLLFLTLILILREQNKKD